MNLKEKINSDYIQSIKNKDKIAKTILSVLKGDIETHAKKIAGEVSDEDIIKILTKSAKSAKEMISAGDADAHIELSIIESYLPKQLSDAEVDNIISDSIKSGSKTIPDIMKVFANINADKKYVVESFKKLINEC